MLLSASTEKATIIKEDLCAPAWSMCPQNWGVEPFEELTRDVHNYDKRRGDLPVQKVGVWVGQAPILSAIGSVLVGQAPILGATGVVQVQ